MAFYDIQYINYANLEMISRSKPFRGSDNAYPLGDRRYSSRHFRKEDDGSFSIWYLNRGVSDELSEGTIADERKQYIDRCASQKLGIVRPDNSFEFLNSSGQGENMLLCEGLRGGLTHCANKGGLVFERGQHIHPVFSGLRINCDTGESMTDYKLFQAVVNRKQANQYMKQFSEFKTVAPVMLSSMDDAGIIQVYDDMYEIHRDSFKDLNGKYVMQLIDEGKYVDALCLFSMITNHLWEIKHGTEVRYKARETGELVPSHLASRLPNRFKERTMRVLETKFRDLAVSTQEDLFESKELQAGKELPESKWDLRVTVNGVTMKRL
jgi:hypothetical protein